MQRVLVFNAHRRYRIRKKLVEKYVRRVVGKRKTTVSVVFVDSRCCKSINKKYLNHNYVTDVISFTIEQTPTLEGEVYINLDRAKQQAREYDVSFANEVGRLVIHGALHLIGYEDQTESERKKMKTVEDKHVHYWFPK
ncbi:MAG: rRNA maturation RNase YbeY [Bacteroidota bacterium]|jgi:rRNA maturation RNase YbeY